MTDAITRLWVQHNLLISLEEKRKRVDEEIVTVKERRRALEKALVETIVPRPTRKRVLKLSTSLTWKKDSSSSFGDFLMAMKWNSGLSS